MPALKLDRELELLRKLEASADEIKALKTRLEYTELEWKEEREKLLDEALDYRDAILKLKTKLQSLDHAARALTPAGSTASASAKAKPKSPPRNIHAPCARIKQQLEKENAALKGKLNESQKELARLELQVYAKTMRRRSSRKLPTPAPDDDENSEYAESDSQPAARSSKRTRSRTDQGEGDVEDEDDGEDKGDEEDEEDDDDEAGGDDDGDDTDEPGPSRRRSGRISRIPRLSSTEAPGGSSQSIRTDAAEERHRLRKRSRSPCDDDASETEPERKSPRSSMANRSPRSTRSSTSQTTLDEDDEDEEDDEAPRGKCLSCEDAESDCERVPSRKACLRCASLKKRCELPPTRESLLDMEASDDVPFSAYCS